MKPLVSICMPTLNSEAFLTPRLESIRRQTLTDWELVVVDSQSDDATLSMIDAFADQGGAVRVYQGPRDGIYTNINRSIEYARGAYIYIATSDDTMADDCLEKMVGALACHESCGLAHCPLKLIDQDGEAVRDDWWSSRSSFALSTGGRIDETHVRQAPHDGLLHLFGRTVYISLTQLLIRRELFDQVGMFRSDWGSISDYYWDMRAALATDTVHVGGTWASWRVHETQATAGAHIGTVEHVEKVSSMVDQAIEDALGDYSVPAQSHLKICREEARALRAFLSEVCGSGSRPARWGYLLRQLLGGSALARDYIFSRFQKGRPDPANPAEMVDKWLSVFDWASIRPSK